MAAPSLFDMIIDVSQLKNCFNILRVSCSYIIRLQADLDVSLTCCDDDLKSKTL